MDKWSCTVIYILFLTFSLTEQTRKVTSPLVNPKCSTECDEPWIVDTVAEGENDTLHHLWGTHGAPTLMVVATNKSAELSVDWDKFLNAEARSVVFTKNVTYVFGFVIPHMILYDDVDDTGTIDNVPEESRLYVPMTDFTWNITEMINSSDHKQGLVFETIKSNGTSLPNDAKISIKVLAYGNEGRSTDLPHLIITPDSAQCHITLDHLPVNITEFFSDEETSSNFTNFTNPRWAIEFVIFSTEHRDKIKEGFKYATHKSLDDENTPGVFNVDDITTNLSRTGGKGGYMQWRPVSYLTSKLEIDDSTFPHINTTFFELIQLDDPTKMSLAFAAFGNDLVEWMVSSKKIFSFGQPKDGFYRKYNYTTWTLAYGIGSPPAETFSDLVIIIISLGIGIPALVFVLGGFFVCFRNLRSN